MLPVQDLLLKASNCFYITLDEKGNFLSANNYFLNRFGFSEGDLLGKSFCNDDILQKDDPLTLEELLEKAENDQVVLLKHNTNASHPLTINWNFAKQPGPNGKIKSIEGLGVEVNTPATPGAGHNHHLPADANLSKIMNFSLDIICTWDNDGTFLTVSKASKNIWGFEPEELEGKKYIDFVHPEDVERTIAVSRDAMNGIEMRFFENRYVKKDGSAVTMFWTAKWEAEDKIMYCVARDGTYRKSFEGATKASEEKYKLLFHKNPQPMWIFELKTFRFLEVNEATVHHYGFSREEFLSMTIKDIRPIEEVPKVVALHNTNESSPTEKTYWKHKKKNGEIIHVEVSAYPLNFEGLNAKLVLSNDITEQVQAEEELIKSNERYTYASKAAFDAIWDWDLKKDEVIWSEGYETMFGYRLVEFKEPVSSWSDHVHPSDRERVLNSIEVVINSDGSSWEEEYRFKKADDTYAYVLDRGIVIRNKKNKAYRMIGAMQDYTQKKKTEQSLKELNASLEKRASELASSNQELERFAYVASHDLQEPLRMVSSFLQLLQRRYKSQLDDKANEYIHFAVDGAERMKVLILDLLKYSRVNTMKEAHEDVDLNEIWNNILFTYKQLIDETNATISIDPMPTVLGTKTQLVQLFQNLLGNALKYRSSRRPYIKVSVKDEKDQWYFSVQDNGIGIDTRFYEKIFVIFQRLHHKDEYSGTGIGLAICKKIAERHGGRIWVESTQGEGSTFYFTLSKNLKNN